MNKILSRTKGNSYHKLDQPRFMLLPKYKDIPRTAFIDVKQLTLEKYADKEESDSAPPLCKIIKIIQQRTF